MKRNFKLPILLLVLTMSISFLACTDDKNINSNTNKNKPAEINKKSEEKLTVGKDFKNINKDGSFVVRANKDGKIEVVKDFTKSTSKNIKQIEWYTDPLCPDCRRAHNATKDYLNEIIPKGEVEIKYHMLDLLHGRTENDYSLVTSAYITGIAEEFPQQILQTIDMIYNDECFDKFKEEKNIEKELMTYLSNHKECKYVCKDIDKYKDIVTKSTKDFRENETLKEMSFKEDHSLFVPFIFDTETKIVLDGENEDAENNVLLPIKIITGCKEEDCN